MLTRLCLTLSMACLSQIGHTVPRWEAVGDAVCVSMAVLFLTLFRVCLTLCRACLTPVARDPDMADTSRAQIGHAVPRWEVVGDAVRVSMAVAKRMR